MTEDHVGRDWLRLPVVSAGAEYLVICHLMRRNIPTYKAPPSNEGYDLICIHPAPRYWSGLGEPAQVRAPRQRICRHWRYNVAQAVQMKSQIEQWLCQSWQELVHGLCTRYKRLAEL